MPARPPRLAHPHHRVSAVLVVHDGVLWLPECLSGIAGQTRPVQRLVAVDVGSEDGSAALLDAALEAEQVVRVDRDTGFADAVAAGLARLDELGQDNPPPGRPRRRVGDDLPDPEPVSWLWLLHDDAAPDPTALSELISAAEAAPSAAVLGPKVRDWDDERLLVEIGLTMDRAGRRETGLERRELDQGQHDGRCDVLAVGTAAMLVRRDVYDAVGGLDPRLPLLRDDMDLGWRVHAAGHRVVVVPDARIRHARASWTGKRPMTAVVGRPTAIDRRHSLMVLLANLPPFALLGALPRLLVGVLVRTTVFLLTRQLTAARDELAALWWSVRHLGDLRRMRAQRRAARSAPSSELRPLFVGRTARLRGYADAFADWATGGGGEGGISSLDDPDADPSDVPVESGRLRRALQARPVLGVIALLTALTALASRRLYGGGVLVGGDLLPVPAQASALWASYAGSWHQVGAGVDTALSPAVALVALVGTALLGNVRLAVTLLLLGGVVLSGISAWVATRRLEIPVPVRLWAALTYAVLPAVTGAIAGGRLDVVVAAVAAPLLVSGGARLLDADPRHTGWRHAFGYAIGLSIAMAFAPALWLLAVVGLVGGAGIGVVTASPAGRAAALRRVVASGFAVGSPLLLLLPWSLRLLSAPRMLLSGTPAVGGSGVVAADTVDLLLLRPGPLAAPVVWVTLGVVLAALAGLVRQRRQRAALYGWALAIISLVAATAVVRGASALRPASPSVQLVVAACGLLLAGVVAADQALDRLGRHDFGWRQVTAGVVAVAAGLAPVWCAAAWVRRGADDPLRRQDRMALPSVVLAEADRSAGTRVLWLDGSPGETVRYSLTPARGRTFADGALTVDRRTSQALDRLVADLTSPRGSSAAEALAAFNVAYVVVPNPASASLTASLDAQAGLSRVSFVAPVQLWRTLTPTGRLTVLAPGLAAVAVTGDVASRDELRQTPPVVLPSRRESARAQLLPGPPGRLLVLAERADDDWEAALDGKALTSTTAYGWAQAFELPAGAGVVTVRRDGSARQGTLTVQALLLLVVVVLAAPPIRRRDDDGDGSTVSDDEVGATVDAGDVDRGSDDAVGSGAGEPITSGGSVRTLP